MSHVYPIPIIFLDGYQCHIHVSYKECAHMHKNTKTQVSKYLSRCNIKWDICWKKNSHYQYLFLYIYSIWKWIRQQPTNNLSDFETPSPKIPGLGEKYFSYFWWLTIDSLVKVINTEHTYAKVSCINIQVLCSRLKATPECWKLTWIPVSLFYLTVVSMPSFLWIPFQAEHGIFHVLNLLWNQLSTKPFKFYVAIHIETLSVFRLFVEW